MSRRHARWLEYLKQTFHYRWKYCPGRSNIVDPLSTNPLDEKHVMLALLTRRTANRSYQPVAADIGRIAPMEMTNTRKNLPVFDNEFFNKIIVGYALDLWFKDPVNLEKLVFKDAIWGCQEEIIVPDVGSLCKCILFEYHDVFYSGHMGVTKTFKHVETSFWWPKLRDVVRYYYPRFWIALCNVLGTKQTMFTTFHPQTDGQTKRVNMIV